MSKLVFGVSKIISKKQEDAAGYDIVALSFAEAYAQLRQACPGGDLRIHLSIEADSAEEVGAKLEPRLPEQWNCEYCGYGEYKNRADWERRAADHVETHSDAERGLTILHDHNCGNMGGGCDCGAAACFVRRT